MARAAVLLCLAVLAMALFADNAAAKGITISGKGKSPIVAVSKSSTGKSVSLFGKTVFSVTKTAPAPKPAAVEKPAASWNAEKPAASAVPTKEAPQASAPAPKAAASTGKGAKSITIALPTISKSGRKMLGGKGGVTVTLPKITVPTVTKGASGLTISKGSTTVVSVGKGAAAKPATKPAAVEKPAASAVPTKEAPQASAPAPKAAAKAPAKGITITIPGKGKTITIPSLFGKKGL